MKPTEQWLADLRRDIVYQTRVNDVDLTFHSTWGLFSPRELDEGSRLLLQHIELKPGDAVFDLGCGYGPLGIAIAKQVPNGHVLMADKDFIAVDFARKNIEINRLSHAEALMSNGFDQIGEQKFDLVVSNIPAKVGKELLTLFLHDALAHLNPGGRMVVVTINGLRQFMKRNFNEVFGNYDKLKQGKNYTVAQAIKH